VNSGEQYPPAVTPAIRASQIRRGVIEAAADMKRDQKGGQGFTGPAPGRVYQRSRESGHDPVLDTYLALLHDQLPVYVRALVELDAGAGQDTVADRLRIAARADIDFHCVILGAKMALISRPDQLVCLRDAMDRQSLSPRSAEDRVTQYLEHEQQLGRVAADVSARGVARLLLGACLSYAFSAALMGESALPPRAEFVDDIIRGLHLPAEHTSSGGREPGGSRPAVSR
jgi:hypothetical protein